MRRKLCCGALAAVVMFTLVAPAAGQRRSRRARRDLPAKFCHDPNAPCDVNAPFEPYDLSFVLPRRTSVIWESQEFHVVILKSVRAREGDCEAFIPEAERLAAQALFPKRKVFTSRCNDAVRPFYTNVAPDQRYMAVWAGVTRAEAARTLAAVKATGKFPGANLRRMRAGFNGT